MGYPGLRVLYTKAQLDPRHSAATALLTESEAALYGPGDSEHFGGSTIFNEDMYIALDIMLLHT